MKGASRKSRFPSPRHAVLLNLLLTVAGRLWSASAVLEEDLRRDAKVPPARERLVCHTRR